MSYILQNNNSYYCVVTSTNAIKKTTNISEATRFDTEAKANNIIKRASKKLKDYKIVKEEKVLEEENNKKEIPIKKNMENSGKTERRQFTNGERNAVYNRAHGICEICGKFVPNNAFTVDHIIPISKGGTYDMDNLQLAHTNCNQMKVDALPDDFYDKMITILKYRAKNDMRVRKKIKKKFRKICTE